MVHMKSHEKPVLKCALCGKQMLNYVDTWLCPDCNWEQIYELYMNYRIKKGRKWR